MRFLRLAQFYLNLSIQNSPISPSYDLCSSPITQQAPEMGQFPVFALCVAHFQHLEISFIF